MMKVEITQYFQTLNPCYKAGRTIKPSGIVVHSTGANNAYIRRYVGPDDGILGLNKNGNHWNRDMAKSVHYIIGKRADGAVDVAHILPEAFCAWGVIFSASGTIKTRFFPEKGRITASAQICSRTSSTLMLFGFSWVTRIRSGCVSALTCLQAWQTPQG